jgi:hypothetical protein
MGEFRSSGTDSPEIRVPLNEASSAATIQSLLRSLAYGMPSNTESTTLVSVSAPQPAPSEEQASVMRTLTIEISGIRYGKIVGDQAAVGGAAEKQDNPQTLSPQTLCPQTLSPQTLSPQTLSKEIKIEIDSQADQTGT